LSDSAQTEEDKKMLQMLAAGLAEYEEEEVESEEEEEYEEEDITDLGDSESISTEESEEAESESEEEEEEIVEEEVEVTEEPEEEEEVEIVEEKKEKRMKEEKKGKKDTKRYASTEDSDDSGEDDNVKEAVVDTLKKKPKKKQEKKKVKNITEVDKDDDEEARTMKGLLAGYGKDDSDRDETEEESESSEREVILDDNVLDHIVLAAPDLDAAMKQFHKCAGIEPVIFGSIKGLGIKCARVSFNDSSYIEIIAPDPKRTGPIGDLIKAKGIKEMVPFHYAIRSSKIETLKDEVTQFGYTTDRISMFGAKADGTPRKWEVLHLYGHKMGGICPFFINWANSDHPCATLPVVGKLKKFTVRAPEGDPVHELLEHVGAEDINIEVGKPKFSFQFSSPEGTVKFSSSKAVGFKFPGFEDEEGDDSAEDYGEDDSEVVFELPSAPELIAVGDLNDYEDEDSD
jgi:chemotaxis protein histidine kinase CheA